MKEYFIRLDIGADGRVRQIATYTRDEIMRELMRPRRVRGGAFAIDPEDRGDLLLLKRAVAAVGGTRALCYDLDVSRETLYNWKNRGLIPSGQRAAIMKLIANAGAEVDDYEGEDDDE